MRQLLDTAFDLHRYMLANQWTGSALTGPDVGVRFNIRITRFIKSYLRGIDWRDNYYYLQAQGYWTLANWNLFALTGDKKYLQIATRCSDGMILAQRIDGAWDYPNPEWRGRIATAEGTWASIGLLETYRMTGDRRYLRAALRWYDYLVDQVKFVRNGEELAVNYFSNRPSARVPNNSAFVLRFLAELAEASHNPSLLAPCVGLIRFLVNSQTKDGELPYAINSTSSEPARPHYQCYQYNAFQCLDIMRYRHLTGDSSVDELLQKLVRWIGTGVESDGHVRFDCSRKQQRVAYHTTVVAAVFVAATGMGLVEHQALADKCFRYVQQIQLQDGSFGFSEADYRILKDCRRYPRSLAMMLFHLLAPLMEHSRVEAPSGLRRAL